jgi:hypothetical protein
MNPVDCACVIHGDYYDWQYVERLYNMLTARCDRAINLHVYTEAERDVPDYMIKHELTPWPGISGPRRSWWYKMQLFNSELFSGQLLYLDLDTVIVDSIDWIWQLDPEYFYAIHDFKHLWRPQWTGINSSLMLWNTDQYHWIWETVVNQGVEYLSKRYPGDQDLLSKLLIQDPKFRYFKSCRAVSWRWQALDGGYDMKNRRHLKPGTGTQIEKNTSFLIFHGNPKPHNVADPVVQQHWQIRHIV